ncbi:porin [Mangrovimonas sp. YM274]|uniref:porin n=1 Tax=Mangrovimonas sp. YM274 TaxID=3070660 RepID=UPI0027DB1D0E|nr:porin [Mangrovimonas sp. YM274]WMI68658.1 porin [Mangrovimonas sp. YM274]
MKLKLTALAVMLCCMLTSHAQETNSPKFGKGLFNLVGKDSSWTMKIGARVQLLGSTTWTENDGDLGNLQSSMLVRRSRLKFDGYALTPKLKYKLEFGLSNRDMSGASYYTHNSPRFVMDAVMKWNFHGNFVLWFGQTKLPGNRERVISSANLQFVDRSILNAGFNIDRDMGIQLHHQIAITKKFVIKEVLAISQGEGRNVTTGNLGGQQYTGRLEMYPFGTFEGKEDYMGSDLKRTKSPKLALGVSYDFNDNAVRTRSNMGTYMETDNGLFETDITTLFVDAMFKYRGLSIMGEYANRDADTPVAVNSDGTPTGDIVQVGSGYNLSAGYLFKSNWEVAGRYANTDFKEITGRDTTNEYTLGVSKYIVGHKLKVQSDITYADFAVQSDKLGWRLQFEIHF